MWVGLVPHAEMASGAYESSLASYQTCSERHVLLLPCDGQHGLAARAGHRLVVELLDPDLSVSATVKCV